MNQHSELSPSKTPQLSNSESHSLPGSTQSPQLSIKFSPPQLPEQSNSFAEQSGNSSVQSKTKASSLLIEFPFSIHSTISLPGFPKPSPSVSSHRITSIAVPPHIPLQSSKPSIQLPSQS